MALLISPEYAEQNRLLHEHRKDYGVIGHRWAKRAAGICRDLGYTTVIDYGCGKRTFEKKMREIAPHVQVQSFDPATNPVRPRPAELLVCTDVLEHVEPDYLDAVLKDIRGLCESALIVVALEESDKTLPDGRNAHLIVRPGDWWADRFHEVGFREESADYYKGVFEFC